MNKIQAKYAIPRTDLRPVCEHCHVPMDFIGGTYGGVPYPAWVCPICEAGFAGRSQCASETLASAENEMQPETVSAEPFVSDQKEI